MNAAAYMRVSTLEQAKEGFSLAAQEQKIDSYIKAMNYNKVGSYIDDGYSGKSLERPAIQKLITDIKLNKIDIVIIYKLDRLSRNVKNVLELVELFQQHEVKLYSLTESLDLTSAFGRAALKMSATFSELERETIIERTKLGREQRAKNGMASQQSVLPIGYDFDKEKQQFFPIPEEAEQVRKIFELYLQGWSYMKISAFMHTHYKNRYNSYSDRFSVGRILRNPFSSGYFTFAGQLYKAKNIIPIISYETWLKAEAIRLGNLQKSIRPTSPYLLTGLVYCGVCGHRFVCRKHFLRYKKKDGSTVERDRRDYGCVARVKFDSRYHKEKCTNVIIETSVLDNYVVNIIKNITVTGFKYNEAQNTMVSEILMEIEELKTKKEKLLDLYMEELISKKQFEARNIELDKEIDKKEKLLSKQKSDVVPAPEIDINSLNKKIASWDSLDMYEKRLLLRCLIKRITITGNDINIDFMVNTK